MGLQCLNEQIYMKSGLKQTSDERKFRIEYLKNRIKATNPMDQSMFKNYGSIVHGDNIDLLRKEIIQEILLQMLNCYHPQMKIVPCKDHLVEKGIEIEKALFKNMNIDLYTNPKVIRWASRKTFKKNIIDTRSV
jgi:hypothetical protein